MHCYLIRHAIAEDRASFAGPDDALRPLTDKGIERMRRQADALARFCAGPAVIWTSPYRRARQTADILAAALGIDRIESDEVLAPSGTPAKVADRLAAFDGEHIMLVGHEPNLGILASYLLTADGTAVNFVIKKGSALALELDRKAAGIARLLWMMTPAQLRALGSSGA